MKAKYILAAIAVATSSLVFAGGNDPQVSINNYKHPSKAAQAQAEIDAKNGTEITQVNKQTENAGNYKSNFKKSTIAYEKTEANKEVYPSNARPEARNYKNQFQFRSR